MARPSRSGVRFMIQREGALWSYHRIFPKNLAPLVVGRIELPWRGRVVNLTGQKVVKITLGTSDKAEATRRRDEVNVKVERLLENARRSAIQTSLAADPIPVAGLTTDQIRRMADQVYHEMLDADDKWVLDPVGSASRYVEDHELMADFMRHGGPADFLDSRYADDSDPAHSLVGEMLASNGLILADDHPDRRRLALAMHRAMVRAQTDILKRHKELEGIETPAAPAKLRQSVPNHRGSGKTLKDAFDGYCAEKRPKPKTAHDYQLYCTRFDELFGAMPITAITTEMMLDFKDALLQVPVDIPRALKGRSFKEVVDWGRAHPEIPKLSASTINDRGLGGVSAILGWAVDQRWISRNPRAGVKVAVPAMGADGRAPYEIEDLQKIFALPVFTSGARPLGGAGEAAFWIPLIALWSGMRLQEIGQLRVSDVKEQSDIHFLALQIDKNAGVETSIKTSDSVRRVPVHRELIRLGLIDYAARQRREGQVRLFPELHSTRETITAGWSKWWGRYARGVIPDTRKVFHSFRHAAKDAWRDTDADENVVRAIMGHQGTGTAANYGRGYSLQRLNNTLQMLAYPGLDLSRVRALVSSL